MIKYFSVLSMCFTLVLVASCTATPPKLKEGQYWQRMNVSESTYLRGPKAQQMLNRDIARCVTELKELERLGQLRDTIPADSFGRVLGPDELELARHDTPERDGHLWAEHGNYHDLESCMQAAGWERTTNVGFKAAARAENNYRKTHANYKHQSKFAHSHGSSRAADEFND